MINSNTYYNWKQVVLPEAYFNVQTNNKLSTKKIENESFQMKIELQEGTYTIKFSFETNLYPENSHCKINNHSTNMSLNFYGIPVKPISTTLKSDSSITVTLSIPKEYHDKLPLCIVQNIHELIEEQNPFQISCPEAPKMCKEQMSLTNVVLSSEEEYFQLLSLSKKLKIMLNALMNLIQIVEIKLNEDVMLEDAKAFVYQKTLRSENECIQLLIHKYIREKNTQIPQDLINAIMDTQMQRILEQIIHFRVSNATTNERQKFPMLIHNCFSYFNTLAIEYYPSKDLYNQCVYNSCFSKIS